MKEMPLRTTVIGSYPFPAWLEFASQHLDEFGVDDIKEMQEDAVTAAIHDQTEAGLDVITDGEQSRLDFNLSFYGYLHGIDPSVQIGRKWGPPAHDQRGKYRINDELRAPDGLGVVEEFERLRRVQNPGIKKSNPSNNEGLPLSGLIRLLSSFYIDRMRAFGPLFYVKRNLIAFIK